jgi:hypothetical protein
VHSKNREIGSFKEARKFARALKLNKMKEWLEWAKSNERPVDIPRYPNEIKAYKAEWREWGDWLGTGNVHLKDRPTRPFKEARDFARGVGPKTQREWQEWAMSDKRPPDIPSNPRQVYSEEWRGWGDWLGIGSARGGIPGVYKPFEEARKFVRRQGLVFQVAHRPLLKATWFDLCACG